MGYLCTHSTTQPLHQGAGKSRKIKARRVAWRRVRSWVRFPRGQSAFHVFNPMIMIVITMCLFCACSVLNHCKVVSLGKNKMVTQVVAHHTTDCEIPCWIVSKASFSVLLISGASLNRSLTEMQHDWLLTFQQKWRLSLRWKMSEEDETRWSSSRCIEAIEWRLELKRSSKGSVCTLINSNGEIRTKASECTFCHKQTWTDKKQRSKRSSGCGAVGSAVASDTRGPRFKSQHSIREEHLWSYGYRHHKDQLLYQFNWWWNSRPGPRWFIGQCEKSSAFRLVPFLDHIETFLYSAVY